MRKLTKAIAHLRGSFVELMKASPVYRWTALVSLVLAMLTTLLPAWKIFPLRDSAPFIPLHYNIYIGIDRFGPWYHAFIPAALAVALLLINLLFEAAFFRREKVLSMFFAVATVFAEAVLFVAILLTVLLNL